MKKSIKTLSLATVAIAFTALSSAVYADLSGKHKAIAMDGFFSDWSIPGDALYTDSEIGDGKPDNSAYKNVCVANDAAKLYIGFETKGNDGGSITNTWTHNIYIETDMNADTGFNGGWMRHGYDRLIQYGNRGGSYSVFEFTGATQEIWGWNHIGLIEYAYSKDVTELSIPLNLLGVTNQSIVVVLNATGTGVTSEAWASEFEKDAETYTMAVQNPAASKKKKIEG